MAESRQEVGRRWVGGTGGGQELGRGWAGGV
jgi:hypothetical protein